MTDTAIHHVASQGECEVSMTGTGTVQRYIGLADGQGARIDDSVPGHGLRPSDVETHGRDGQPAQQLPQGNDACRSPRGILLLTSPEERQRTDGPQRRRQKMIRVGRGRGLQDALPFIVQHRPAIGPQDPAWDWLPAPSTAGTSYCHRSPAALPPASGVRARDRGQSPVGRRTGHAVSGSSPCPPMGCQSKNSPSRAKERPVWASAMIWAGSVIAADR